MKAIKAKVDLYILSLALLFVLIIVLRFQLPKGIAALQDRAWWQLLLEENVLSLVCLSLLTYCAYTYWSFIHTLAGTAELPRKCPHVRQVNYEPLTFLTSFILPLLSLNIEGTRSLIVIAVLLVTVGAIYIKTGLLYKNPSLVLLGFSIYTINEEGTSWGPKDETIFICRESIVREESLRFIELDDNVYYVRKSK
jgi:hypothetical protein